MFESVVLKAMRRAARIPLENLHSMIAERAMMEASRIYA